jgi:hypothetical protein
MGNMVQMGLSPWKTSLLKANGPKFLGKHDYSRQVCPSFHEKMWFPNVSVLLEANHVPQSILGLICKFLKEDIGLKYTFSLDNLLQPIFLI